MNFRTLLKTESIEIQQSERGSVSYAYSNAGDAMHDLYAKIVQLEADVAHHNQGWNACTVENNQLRAQVERLRERLQLEMYQFIGIREYTQDGKLAAICADHESQIRDLLEETPAQSTAEIEAGALERLANKIRCNGYELLNVVDLDKEADRLRQLSSRSGERGTLAINIHNHSDKAVEVRQNGGHIEIKES